jgi:hypothetical protein
MSEHNFELVWCNGNLTLTFIFVCAGREFESRGVKLPEAVS